MTARVARLCPPGKWWFIAVCEGCRWTGMSWRDKSWAVSERDQHNEREHAR